MDSRSRSHGPTMKCQEDNSAGVREFVRRSLCPACESDGAKILYQSSYDHGPVFDMLSKYYSRPWEPQYLRGATYCLARCRSCRLVYQVDVPSDELLSRIYEHWISDDPVRDVRLRWSGGENSYAYDFQEITAAISVLGGRPWEMKFLDFGMGWGEWCHLALSCGVEAFGSELSCARIMHAQRKGICTVTWDEIPSHEFDMINSEQVFEHLVEPLLVLRHLALALKPHGLLRIAVPNGEDVERRLRVGNWTAARGSRNSLHCVHPLEHINCFSRHSLVRMAALAGLKPFAIPLNVQYFRSMAWTSGKRMVRNLARPLYRSLLHRGTCVFFVRS